MNFTGLIIGLSTFLCIGLFHPIVIKAEYYWGVGCWWIFMLLGIGCVVGSLFVGSVLWAAVLGVAGFFVWWLLQKRKAAKAAKAVQAVA